MAKKNRSYTVDIQMWGIEIKVNATGKVEAKKKAINKLSRSIRKHINRMYVEEND